MSNALQKETQKHNLTHRTGRPRHAKQEAWNVTKLLKQTSEDQGKLTQEAWRELDVLLRSHLRKALRKKGDDALPARSVKDLAIAASTCNLRAYPESNANGLGAHVPARLLQVVSDRLMKAQAIPIDVTPEPQPDLPQVDMTGKPSA